MKCFSCGHENPASCEFCVQCHTPLRFTCPACKHTQDHGGQCDACGVVFIKYAAMLAFTNKSNLQQERARKAGRNAIVRQILLLPITGGWSLLNFFRRSMTRD